MKSIKYKYYNSKTNKIEYPYLVHEQSWEDFLEKDKTLLYSGLLDVNGNEICEGDILECEIEKGEFMNYEVVFEYGYFGLSRKTSKCPDIKPSLLYPWAGIGKIVGNIIESPQFVGIYQHG